MNFFSFWIMCRCRSAFKSLAYKKYQQVALYLEWAPKDIWDTPPSAAAAAKPTAAAAAAAAPVSSKAPDQAAAAAAAADDEEDDQSGRPVGWIYVKNVNFSTTDAALKKHFDKAVSAAGGVIHSAKVSQWFLSVNNVLSGVESTISDGEVSTVTPLLKKSSGGGATAIHSVH